MVTTICGWVATPLHPQSTLLVEVQLLLIRAIMAKEISKMSKRRLKLKREAVQLVWVDSLMRTLLQRKI